MQSLQKLAPLPSHRPLQPPAKQKDLRTVDRPYTLVPNSNGVTTRICHSKTIMTAGSSGISRNLTGRILYTNSKIRNKR